MNTFPDSIRIEYKLKAVAMKVITKEQALIFGLLKAKGAMSVLDLSLATGLTKLKVTRVVELLEALEKCQVVGDQVIFMESFPIEVPSVVASADAKTEAAASPAPLVSVIDKQRNKGRPSSVDEVLEYISTNLSTSNYSYLNRPDTDLVASANKFFDFYESKGWLVGRSPMKSWQSAARRAFTDQQSDGKRPWAVVKFSAAQMAARMDAVDASAASKVSESTPAQSLPAPSAPAVVPAIAVAAAPSELNQRRGILANRLSQKLGPAPVQTDFCADPYSGVSNSEYLAYQDALRKYNGEFSLELDKLLARFASVPTQDLYSVEL